MKLALKKQIILSFLLIMACSVHAQHVQYLARISQCETNPPDFAKLPYDEANQKVNNETRHKICAEYITNLVNQLLQGDLGNDKKVLVIYLLGEFRPTDTKSIEALIKYIDFKAIKMDEHTGLARWGAYPAEEALIKIGMPSTISVLSGLSDEDRGKAVVNPVLNHLPSESNTLRQHLMCETLVRIEGKKGPHFDEAKGRLIVQDQIKDKLANEPDPAKRANLEAASKEMIK